MKKYCVISDCYDLDNWYDPALEFRRFLNPKQRSPYPVGVKCYYYNSLVTAEKRISKEFLKGRYAKLYSTDIVAQQYADYLKHFVEPF